MSSRNEDVLVISWKVHCDPIFVIVFPYRLLATFAHLELLTSEKQRTRLVLNEFIPFLGDGQVGGV